jgi:hypothetical protein
VLQLLYTLIQIIHPILVPICFTVAWTFVLMLGWTMFSAIRDTSKKAQTMHQIPCSNCQYFTNDYRLKCTVNPHYANTEGAINCKDYHSTSYY